MRKETQRKKKEIVSNKETIFQEIFASYGIQGNSKGVPGIN
jgi:hypothetical protein